MANKPFSNDQEGEKVPFKMHPRVFAALGADLVTSDVVAVIELVKNCYDAFAERVDVSFASDDHNNLTLEIKDDGQGMDAAIIDNVWCTVATPFRLNQKIVLVTLIRFRLSPFRPPFSVRSMVRFGSGRLCHTSIRDSHRSCYR